MISHSPSETRTIGEHLAAQLQPGDVVLLYGDLGAGKSELTRGIARGLGIDGPISSPSFTIMNLYEGGRVPLCHFDWYRLNSAEELWEMGMDECLGGADIAIVEWPTQCPEAIPDDHLKITIAPIDETTRNIILESKGSFRLISEEALQ